MLILTIYFYLKIKNSEKLKSLRRLCSLNKKQLHDYFNSYNMIFDDQNMITTREDYDNHKQVAAYRELDKKPSEYTADCYLILKDLCALGNVKKMVIPAAIDKKKSFLQNQILHEKEIARELKVSENANILEIGCGCGRIMESIQKETKCNVFGINIDQTQIDDGNNHAKKTSNNKLKLVFCDLNDRTPFDDNFFDGIYTMGGFLTFLNKHQQVFDELFRITKKGGIIRLSDCVLLDDFNRNNQEHIKLVKNSRYVLAGSNLIYYKYIEDFAKKSGFQVISSKSGEPPNISRNAYFLRKEHQHFGRIETACSILTKCRILPNYFNDIIKRLRYGADDLIQMEEKNLLTMTWDFTFQKPL